MSIKKFLGVVSILVMTLSLSSLTYATSIKSIKEGEIRTKSQFIHGTDFYHDGQIQGDLYVGAKMISSTGTISGDLIAGAQTIRSTGTIGGDVICGGRDVDISGEVKGNIRSGASNIYIGADIDRNVNIVASNANIKEKSTIGGNLIAVGEYINIAGKIKGYTKVIGNRITLGGEFFGDVDINLEIPSEIRKEWKDDKGHITILSGTKIHGKLTYKSTKEARIENSADLSNMEWIEITKVAKGKETPGIGELISEIFKTLLSIAVYFIIGMLIYKVLPATFKKQGELVEEEPFKMMGIGLLGIASIIASAIALVIIIILSVLLSSVEVGIIATLITVVFYIVLIYLSFIPVSLWLGNRILKDKYNLPIRFATGLTIASLGVHIIAHFHQLPAIGPVLGLVAFTLVLIISLTGIGSLLTSGTSIVKSVSNEEIE